LNRLLFGGNYEKVCSYFLIALLVLGWGCGGNGGTGCNDDKKDISVTIEIPPGWEERKVEGNIFLYDLVAGEANLDDILDDYHWILESAKYK